jgi:hypothetical protein
LLLPPREQHEDAGRVHAHARLHLLAALTPVCCTHGLLYAS